MRMFLRIFLPVIIVAAAGLVAWTHYHSKAEPSAAASQVSSGSGGLNVSQTGGQIFTDVPGAALQQAAPPSNSAAGTGLNPQSAMPNYCVPGETPIIDGCVSR